MPTEKDLPRLRTDSAEAAQAALANRAYARPLTSGTPVDNGTVQAVIAVITGATATPTGPA